MGLTRISSTTQSSFIQPNLGGIVILECDPSIDWLRVGQMIQIPNGGIYAIENMSGFSLTLVLKTATVAPGLTVLADVIYPVSNNSELEWGAKEW